MVNVISKDILAKEHPKLQFEKDFDLRNVTNPGKDGVIAEFVGTGDFASAWRERRQYEIDAGRDAEPILYTPLYTIVEDSSLPQIVPIFRLGPAGVIFNEIKEGGEVSFVTVQSSDISVRIRQYATALEYSKTLRMYNELWTVSALERQVGVAHNALQNHIHFYPILSASYGANNQTAAASGQGGILQNTLRTIEAGITHAKADGTNPRRGPYNLVISSANMFTIERALKRVPQEGFDEQSSALNMIQNIIVYDGWTGVRGKKTVTYAGVTANRAYLVNAGFKDQDFLSFVKQSLAMAMGNPDISRGIEEQVVWDVHFGAYANPVAAVEEITLPTSGA